MGPPNEDGRWIIGIGGTHAFPTEASTSASAAGAARPVRATRSFASKGSSPNAVGEDTGEADGLGRTERHVVQLIEGGTSKRSDIVDACPETSPATVDRALDRLVGDSLIKRGEKQGHYVVADTAPATD